MCGTRPIRLLIPSLENGNCAGKWPKRPKCHAVEVFGAQPAETAAEPPVHHRRVPGDRSGFRSGCKLIALDRVRKCTGARDHSRDWQGGVDSCRAGQTRHADPRRRLSVIAIGNGAGCRETEQMVVDVLGNELKDDEVVL